MGDRSWIARTIVLIIFFRIFNVESAVDECISEIFNTFTLHIPLTLFLSCK